MTFTNCANTSSEFRFAHHLVGCRGLSSTGPYLLQDGPLSVGATLFMPGYEVQVVTRE